MILLIVLLCLLLIGLIPLGVCAQYGQQGAQAWIIIGPFRFLVFPGIKHKNKRTNSGRARKKDGFESHAQSKEKDRKMTDFLPIVRLVLDFLIDFRRKLCVNELRLRVILAGGDPCDLSLNYGRAWAALANIVPQLDRYFAIKKRDLEIECDYVAESTRINGYIHMTIAVWEILSIGIFHGIKLLRKYLQITRNAKDGAIS